MSNALLNATKKTASKLSDIITADSLLVDAVAFVFCVASATLSPLIDSATSNTMSNLILDTIAGFFLFLIAPLALYILIVA